MSKREVDIAIVLEKPEAGRLVTRKLTDYSLGIYAAPAYLRNCQAPITEADLHRHRLVGYVEEYVYSPALSYVRELFCEAPIGFQCASAIGQLEAVRAGLGLGVLHDFVADRHPELQRVLPDRNAIRAYWIVEHEDTRGIGRIRAVHDHLVRSIEADRAMFMQRKMS